MTAGAASDWTEGFLAHRARLKLCNMFLIVSRSVTRAMTERSVVINFKQLIEGGYGGSAANTNWNLYGCSCSAFIGSLHKPC